MSYNKNQNLVPNNKSYRRYFTVDKKKVCFTANFDSGNLELVDQIEPYLYKLTPGYDKSSQSTEKTFFHFKVSGFEWCIVRFQVTRVHILQKLLKMKQVHVYRPVVREENGKFQLVKRNVKIKQTDTQDALLSFEYEFKETHDRWTEFAFTFPYSYQESISLTKELKLKFQDHPQIYFHSQALTYTKEKRKLQLITITQKCNCQQERQQYFQGIFPDIEPRPYIINKPKIIISGRVHPGQTPASYCIEGVLRFLLDEKDYRSYQLRKNFHFLIIPMLNPDGVYHGMFRGDLNGDNLNRVYVNCSKTKHPTIWAFKQLLSHLEKDSVAFYFDFHAHPSRKQFFIYGNAFPEISQQAEAETFGKVLEHNCPYFHNIDSIFTEKQMSSKDKNDSHTKEGCARVFVHRLFNMIHSYTVECGYFAPGKFSPLIGVDQNAIIPGNYSYVDDWQKCSQSRYTPESYMLMGKSILVTVLDLFHLNPYTRISKSQYKSISNIRKAMATEVYNLNERFRLIDPNCPKKIRQMTNIIEENYYKIRFGKYGLSVSQNFSIKSQKKKIALYSRVNAQRKIISQEKKQKSSSKSQCQIKHEDIQVKLEKTQKEENEFISQNPFLENNLKQQFHLIPQKTLFRQYKSQKKLSSKKMEDLYHLCRIDKLKSISSLILQGENSIKFNVQDKKEEIMKKKIIQESQKPNKKSKIDTFFKKQSLTYGKRNLPAIQKKLIFEKNTINKVQDLKPFLPNLVLEKPKKH